jgi:hypothetical protein
LLTAVTACAVVLGPPMIVFLRCSIDISVWAAPAARWPIVSSRKYGRTQAECDFWRPSGCPGAARPGRRVHAARSRGRACRSGLKAGLSLGVELRLLRGCFGRFDRFSPRRRLNDGVDGAPNVSAYQDGRCQNRHSRYLRIVFSNSRCAARGGKNGPYHRGRAGIGLASA